MPAAQRSIIAQHYHGYIPHVLVTDRFGRPLYDDAGEVDQAVIERYLEKALSK